MKKTSLFLRVTIIFIFYSFTNIYSQTIAIGSQVWCKKNLDVSTFRNGDLIPQAKTNAEWEQAGANKSPAWCYYNNDPAMGMKYGKLYNWYAVNDPRGLAPKGYHIPNYNEWLILINFTGDNRAPKLKGTSGWKASGNGTNVTGFTGLPGGLRYADGAFYYVGDVCCFWSSTEEYGDGKYFELSFSLTDYPSPGGRGLSVRCLKD